MSLRKRSLASTVILNAVLESVERAALTGQGSGFVRTDLCFQAYSCWILNLGDIPGMAVGEELKFKLRYIP